MTKDLNTLLTALYVLIDDHVVPPRTGRGRRPALTDSELITMAVAPQMLQRYDSERRWIRHIHAHSGWRAMFPAMPGQSGYHKRLKAAQPLLCKAILTLALCCPSWFDDMWITDATPVPCGMPGLPVPVPLLRRRANPNPIPAPAPAHASNLGT